NSFHFHSQVVPSTRRSRRTRNVLNRSDLRLCQGIPTMPTTSFQSRLPTSKHSNWPPPFPNRRKG
uniref:Uncharacterized protein n=1 Tax=Globodera pallida TaxID=36090 RepID=A0A183CSN8_GLOPA